MKKINPFLLAMTFAGSFLGAGFVSGQELWQFFGSFGKPGFLGLLLAMILLFLFGMILLYLVRRRGIIDMAEIVVPHEIPWLRTVVGIAEVILLFGVYIIMAAGASSLLEQMLGIPSALGGGLFCLLVFLTSLRGVDSMIRVFSLFVPVLVLSTVLIGGYTVITHDIPAISASSSQNPLLGGWLLSAGTYVSYNLFGSIGILTPVGERIPNRKTLVFGLIPGAVMLSLIAVSILGALWAIPEAAAAPLPMLHLACGISMVVGYIYAVLLFSGMFGASLSAVVATDVYLKENIPFFAKHPRLPMILLSVLTWAGSLFGFSDLVGTIYPIFGYLGIAALIGILIHFFKYFRKSA